jgi:hypothetical protein
MNCIKEKRKDRLQEFPTASKTLNPNFVIHRIRLHPPLGAGDS